MSRLERKLSVHLQNQVSALAGCTTRRISRVDNRGFFAHA